MKSLLFYRVISYTYLVAFWYFDMMSSEFEKDERETKDK